MALKRKLKTWINNLVTGINIKGGLFGKIYLVPNHYYHPVPDLKRIRKERDFFNKKYLTGIELHIEHQLSLIKELGEYARDFKQSFEKKEGYYCLKNGTFGHDDSNAYYSIIQKYKPKHIIEVGAGNNTLVSLSSVEHLKREFDWTTSVKVIEPFPSSQLLRKKEFIDLRISKVEDINLDEFRELKENDILFIDTSHIIKTRNDVVYLFLEVLPILNKGVIVHIHDISIPYEIHPAIFEAGYSWNEQYLLQAMLTYSNRYEILYSGYLITTDYFKEFEKSFPDAKRGDTGGSFYIRVK